MKNFLCFHSGSFSGFPFQTADLPGTSPASLLSIVETIVKENTMNRRPTLPAFCVKEKVCSLKLYLRNEDSQAGSL